MPSFSIGWRCLNQLLSCSSKNAASASTITGSRWLLSEHPGDSRSARIGVGWSPLMFVGDVKNDRRCTLATGPARLPHRLESRPNGGPGEMVRFLHLLERNWLHVIALADFLERPADGPPPKRCGRGSGDALNTLIVGVTMYRPRSFPGVPSPLHWARRSRNLPVALPAGSKGVTITPVLDTKWSTSFSAAPFSEPLKMLLLVPQTSGNVMTSS